MMIKRWKSIVLVFCMLTTLSTVTYAASSGSCGTDNSNVVWSLDNTGLLTIFGTGAMRDYINANNVPWRSLRGQITEVKIESGVTNIGNYAFNSCSNLLSVEVASSVKSIGNYAFSDCVMLKDITLEEGLERIQDNAFAKCSTLPTISLPRTLYYIGQYAFANCTTLSEIVIPSSVDEIKAGTFFNCFNLNRVTLSEHLTAIGQRAFSSTDLQSILIPKSVVLVYDYAFEKCFDLNHIYYPGTELQWSRINVSKPTLVQFKEQIQEQGIQVHLNWTGEEPEPEPEPIQEENVKIENMTIENRNITVEISGEPEVGSKLFVASYAADGELLNVQMHIVTSAGLFAVFMDMEGVKNVRAFLINTEGKPATTSLTRSVT